MQDSMPRAALLSLHARLDDVGPDALDDPGLVQLWGPRYSVYVVAEPDVAVFTLGRLPTAARGRRRAEDTAARLRALLGDGGEVPYGEAGRALDVHHNALRYAAPTGTVLLRWDGARQATIRTVAPPDVEPQDARHELARRWLHVAGPTTPAAFARWAGVPAGQARTTFDELRPELAAVTTPVADAWLLADDLARLDVDGPAADHASDRPAGRGTGDDVRLLPSGDAFWLLHDDDRDLLVPDPDRRDQLWTPRVWPGALLVDGEVVGTWRRAGATVTVDPWRPLDADRRAAVTAEAASLPLPDDGPVSTAWAPAP